MKIGELARRSGLTTPTLRFYEEIGLVSPSKRSPSGYREYDATAQGRLNFISCAKNLGLSLDEIKELLDICDGDGCAASEVRLRHVLAHKIDVVNKQIAEQKRFKRQLEQAYARLSGPATPVLSRELRVIGTSACSCGATCDEESCRSDCECCPTEEVSEA
jgi:DNA-binding transcriptional MerR regulator